MENVYLTMSVVNNTKLGLLFSFSVKHIQILCSFLATDDSSSNGNEQLPPAKKLKKVPKIFDGKFFTITRETSEQIDARCSACEEVKKGKITSTGNFLTHYRLKHQEEFKNLKEYLKSSQNEKQPNESKAVKQPTITESFHSISTDSVRS